MSIAAPTSADREAGDPIRALSNASGPNTSFASTGNPNRYSSDSTTVSNDAAGTVTALAAAMGDLGRKAGERLGVLTGEMDYKATACRERNRACFLVHPSSSSISIVNEFEQGTTTNISQAAQTAVSQVYNAAPNLGATEKANSMLAHVHEGGRADAYLSGAAEKATSAAAAGLGAVGLTGLAERLSSTSDGGAKQENQGPGQGEGSGKDDNASTRSIKGVPGVLNPASSASTATSSPAAAAAIPGSGTRSGTRNEDSSGAKNVLPSGNRNMSQATGGETQEFDTPAGKGTSLSADADALAAHDPSAAGGGVDLNRAPTGSSAGRKQKLEKATEAARKEGKSSGDMSFCNPALTQRLESIEKRDDGGDSSKRAGGTDKVTSAMRGPGEGEVRGAGDVGMVPAGAQDGGQTGLDEAGLQTAGAGRTIAFEGRHAGPVEPATSGSRSIGTGSEGSKGSGGSGNKHKPTLGDKIKGQAKVIAGKMTHDAEKVEEGKELKLGLVEH